MTSFLPTRCYVDLFLGERSYHCSNVSGIAPIRISKTVTVGCSHFINYKPWLPGIVMLTVPYIKRI